MTANQPNRTMPVKTIEPSLLEKERRRLASAQAEKIIIEQRIARHRENIGFLEDNPHAEIVLSRLLAQAESDERAEIQIGQVRS